MKWKKTNKYFKTNTVFHENFLGMIEDSIYLNPNYNEKLKDKFVTLLYSEFHHADVIPFGTKVIRSI